MDKIQYLISVFERLAKESPTIAEYGAILKSGRMTRSDIDALYSLVSEIMESAMEKMTKNRATALSHMLAGLKEKERKEDEKEKAGDVLDTIF